MYSLNELSKFKTVLAASSLLAMIFGYSPSSTSAAEPYNSAQLKFLFTGSEVEGDLGGCLSAVLKFQDSKNYYANFSGDGHLDEGNGTWKIEKTELCLTEPANLYILERLAGNVDFSFENCWRIIPWKWGFAAIDSKGNEDWTMTLNSHPKHSSREELYAALNKVMK